MLSELTKILGVYKIKIKRGKKQKLKHIIFY